MGKDGRWRFGARGKSELHRARVPGESRGGARETARRQSRLARGRPRESNRDQYRFTGVKRAILPAAISESAASRLLAEAGSREPPRRRRRGRSLLGPREMTIGNRTRLTLPPHSSSSPSMVPIAQLAERLSVEQEVAGSCPARHPRKSTFLCGNWVSRDDCSARFSMLYPYRYPYV